MHPKLHVNLTVKHFEMGFETSWDCRDSGLFVRSGKDPRERVTPYCGILSKYFALFENNFVTVAIESTLKLAISGMFSVSEEKYVMSIFESTRNYDVYLNPQLHSLLIVSPSHTTSTLYIRVEPISKIALEMKYRQSDEYFVLVTISDGPSPVGKVTSLQMNMLLESSSFQCLVHVLVEGTPYDVTLKHFCKISASYNQQNCS